MTVAARSASPGGRYTLAVAVTVEAVLATVLVILLAPGRRGFFDLAVYRGAVQHWLAGGPLYEFLLPGSPYGFTYPPFAAIVLSPLAMLGWHTAIAASLVVNVCVVARIGYRYVEPMTRGSDWPRWYPYSLAACGLALLVPVRDTISFGQVNLILLLLVCLDLDRLNRSKWAGFGIGIATAIKLTPALFIAYLLLARRFRAAAVAAGTAAGATLLAAIVAPAESLTFWGSALWDTGRIGNVGQVANQSLRGLVVRLELPAEGLWWLLAVVVVVGVWAVRSRQIGFVGDHETGFALTAVACCLISPITWVHHLVWLLPALFLLARAAAGRRRLGITIAACLPLCAPPTLSGLLGASPYVWIALRLLAWLPAAGTPAVVLPGARRAVDALPDGALRAAGTGPDPQQHARARLGREQATEEQDGLVWAAVHGDRRRRPLPQIWRSS